MSNFRDLGGYATSDGSLVRWGRLYRSSALDRMTDKDAPLFSSLGIRTICDLRSARERSAAPSALPAGHAAATHSIEIASTIGARLSVAKRWGWATFRTRRPPTYLALYGMNNVSSGQRSNFITKVRQAIQAIAKA